MCVRSLCIESAVALLVSFFINLAIVATNFANFYAPKCAQATGGPFACVSLAAYNASGDTGPPDGMCELPNGRGPGVCAELGLDGEGAALQEVRTIPSPLGHTTHNTSSQHLAPDAPPLACSPLACSPLAFTSLLASRRPSVTRRCTSGRSGCWRRGRRLR